MPLPPRPRPFLTSHDPGRDLPAKIAAPIWACVRWLRRDWRAARREERRRRYRELREKHPSWDGMDIECMMPFGWEDFLFFLVFFLCCLAPGFLIF